VATDHLRVGDRGDPTAPMPPTPPPDLDVEPDLGEGLSDYAHRGLRVQIVLRGILVVFVVAVVLWIAPARDRVGCYTIAAIYAAWAIGVAWLARRRVDQLLRFVWLALFVDLAALVGLAVVASASVNQSWTSDVLVNGFFMIPILAATQPRPWVGAAVAAPTVAAYLGASIAAKSANGEPWSSVILRTGILAGICVGSVMLSRVQQWRVRTIGHLLADRNQLITALTTIEDRERRTLSEDLHDGALQYVLAARQDLDEARETADPSSFDRVDHALRETSHMLRSMMTQLHPAVLDQSGFLPALRDLVRTSSERGRFVSTIEAGSWDESWRTSADGLLLAAARELLTNVVKHAGAHTVDIDLSWRDGIARLRITDDGRGISPGEVERQLALGHIGLTSRRVRLEAAGGSLVLRPGTSSGTVAEVEVPAAQQVGSALIGSDGHRAVPSGNKG
jgi:two-component system, NarL family, sensor kinase